MAYHYHTEAIYLEEKWLGRTGAHSTAEIAALSARLNQMSASGWELFRIAEVDVVGKLFKADERRSVTVAIYRREAATAPEPEPVPDSGIA